MSGRSGKSRGFGSGPVEIDTEHRDWPVCPYCGHVHDDAWEWNFGPGLEGDTEVECHHCNRTFYVERCVTVTYSTRGME